VKPSVSLRATLHIACHVVVLLEASELLVPHCHVTWRPAGRFGGAVKLAVSLACWTPTFRGHLAAGSARRHRSITANSTTSSFLQSLSLSLLPFSGISYTLTTDAFFIGFISRKSTPTVSSETTPNLFALRNMRRPCAARYYRYIYIVVYYVDYLAICSPQAAFYLFHFCRCRSTYNKAISK